MYMFTKSQVRSAWRSVMKGDPRFKGFELMTLKNFLDLYSTEINYEMEFKKKNKSSPYGIICLVDTRQHVKHTMSDARRKSLRKAGGAKRRRVKQKYHYENVFNRIHGYLLLEDQQKNKNIPRSIKAMSLSLVCSSYYSNMKGIGTLLMNSMKSLAEKAKYTDIILEVVNEHAGTDEEESEEESEDESEEEYEDSINQPLIDAISKEFMRKVVRISEEGLAYYSIGDDYIGDIIYSYLEDEYEYESYDEYFKEVDFSEPGENEYGGYFYSKGKRSQLKLFQFYEKFGFKEDYKVHLEWKSFTTDPFPSMILNL
jgi:hypothetical protein